LCPVGPARAAPESARIIASNMFSGLVMEVGQLSDVLVQQVLLQRPPPPPRRHRHCS
jgi:hypothetical protein